MDYNPLFITFCEGLRETQHPYRFIVEKGLSDLIEAPNAAAKIRDLMPLAITSIRNGLGVQERVAYYDNIGC